MGGEVEDDRITTPYRSAPLPRKASGLQDQSPKKTSYLSVHSPGTFGPRVRRRPLAAEKGFELGASRLLGRHRAT
jgi:hypothetical protein